MPAFWRLSNKTFSHRILTQYNLPSVFCFRTYDTKNQTSKGYNCDSFLFRLLYIPVTILDSDSIFKCIYPCVYSSQDTPPHDEKENIMWLDSWTVSCLYYLYWKRTLLPCVHRSRQSVSLAFVIKYRMKTTLAFIISVGQDVEVSQSWLEDVKFETYTAKLRN